MILDDENGPRWFIETLHDPMEVDQWSLPLHGDSQTDIVSMLGIGTAIAIAEESPFDKAVVVGAIAMLDWRCRRYRERQLGQNCWLEDPLGADQRDSKAFEIKSWRESGTWD